MPAASHQLLPPGTRPFQARRQVLGLYPNRNAAACPGVNGQPIASCSVLEHAQKHPLRPSYSCAFLPGTRGYGLGNVWKTACERNHESLSTTHVSNRGSAQESLDSRSFPLARVVRIHERYRGARKKRLGL